MANIALIIGGNADAGGGFMTLVSIGVFPAEERTKMDQRPTIDEQQSYKIKHGATHAIYYLTDLAVKSAGASRDGRLTVAIAIPQDQQLANNISPLLVLRSLYQKFIDDFTTTNVNGYHTFLPVNGNYPREPFEAILNQYQTQPRRGAYIVMRGVQPGVVRAEDDQKLALLFRDSQYPKFTEYSEVEVGKNSTPSIIVEIPRQHAYKVYLNDEYANVTLQQDEDTYESHLQDTPYETYQNVRFSLGQLLNSPEGRLADGQVRIDYHTENIYCEVKPKERSFIYNTRVFCGDNVTDTDQKSITKWLGQNAIRLSFGETDITKNFLEGSDVVLYGRKANGTFKVEPATIGDFKFSVTKDEKERALVLNVEKVVPKPIVREEEPRQPAAGGKRGGQNGDASKGGGNGLTVSVISSQSMTAQALVAVLTSSNKERQFLRQPLTFIPKEAGKKPVQRYYEATFIVDTDWTRAGETTIRLEDPANQLKSNEVPLSFVNGAPAPLHLEDFKLSPNKKVNGLTKLIAVSGIAALVALLAGFGIGYALFSKGGGVEKEELKALTEENRQKDIRIKELENQLKEAEFNDSKETESVKEEEHVEEAPEPPVADADAGADAAEQAKKAAAAAAEKQKRDEIQAVVEAVNNRNFLTAERLPGWKHLSAAQKAAIGNLNVNNYSGPKKAKAETFMKGKKITSIEQIMTLSNQIKAELGI